MFTDCCGCRFAQYNARHYWQIFDSLPKPAGALPGKFPIMDSFSTQDGDIQASRKVISYPLAALVLSETCADAYMSMRRSKCFV